MHANIPESAKLRIRWTADSGTHNGVPGNSDGWLFSLDDVGISLAAAGDANLDGEVQFDDFLALSANFGQAGTWEQGDFDGDGQVDFLALSANFGGGANPPAASVPEPHGLSIALFGLLGLIGFRKRR